MTLRLPSIDPTFVIYHTCAAGQAKPPIQAAAAVSRPAFLPQRRFSDTLCQKYGALAISRPQNCQSADFSARFATKTELWQKPLLKSSEKLPERQKRDKDCHKNGAVAICALEACPLRTRNLFLRGRSLLADSSTYVSGHHRCRVTPLTKQQLAFFAG